MIEGPRRLVLALQALHDGTVVWERWRGGEGADEPRDRVDICRLYDEGKGGSSAALLRYAPNARVPQHQHSGYEHVFVLEGSQEDDSGVYPAGTLVINPPGTRHTVFSPKGCIVLVIWHRPVTFTDAQPKPS